MESPEMTATLTVPTEEQATSFMRELGFEDRFMGYVLKASGQMAVTVYTLEAAILFLGQDNTAYTVVDQFPGHDVHVAYMEPKALVDWIREVIGDVELADAIEAASSEIPQESGYPPQLRSMRELMSQRFLQYLDVLGIGPDAGVEGGTDAEPTGT
jgi:hypothetical protein